MWKEHRNSTAAVELVCNDAGVWEATSPHQAQVMLDNVLTCNLVECIIWLPYTSTIKIWGLPLPCNFSQDVLEYSVEVPYEQNTLSGHDISDAPIDEGKNGIWINGNAFNSSFLNGSIELRVGVNTLSVWLLGNHVVYNITRLRTFRKFVSCFEILLGERSSTLTNGDSFGFQFVTAPHVYARFIRWFEVSSMRGGVLEYSRRSQRVSVVSALNFGVNPCLKMTVRSQKRTRVLFIDIDH